MHICSYLCFNTLLLYLRVSSSLKRSLLLCCLTLCRLLFLPLFLCPSSPEQGDTCNEVQMQPKENDDDYLLYSSALSLSFASAALHLLPSRFHSSAFILSVCHSLSHSLGPNSTFHQLLVSPNSHCVDVDGLGTFNLILLKCGSLK